SGAVRSATSRLTTTVGAVPNHPRAVERGTPRSVAMVRSPTRRTSSGADGHSGAGRGAGLSWETIIGRSLALLNSSTKIRGPQLTSTGPTTCRQLVPKSTECPDTQLRLSATWKPGRQCPSKRATQPARRGVDVVGLRRRTTWQDG